jgi:hypothetical protein
LPPHVFFATPWFYPLAVYRRPTPSTLTPSSGR